MRLKLTPAFVQKSPQAIIALHQDAVRASDLIFTNDGRRPLGNFPKLKRKFDEACGVRGWCCTI